jgi:hypothetical protein
MAPELINKTTYNLNVDIWACGFLLFILCSGGQHPLFTVNMSPDSYTNLFKNKVIEWDFPKCFPL